MTSPSPAQMSTDPPPPFVGLHPFTVEQAPYFFGREEDAALLEANVTSRRLTLLYGPSGVGKTSLITAGLIPQLQANARANVERRGMPGFVPVLFRLWQEDPRVEIATRLRKQCEALVPGSVPAATPPDLEGLLRTVADGRVGDVLLILDQFELFFVYHDVRQHPLSHILTRCVPDRRLSLNVLISIREDWLPALDVFKGQIPGLFGNYLRLRKLDREAASAAVTGPVERYNQRHGTAIRMDHRLLEAVLARSVEVQPTMAPPTARPTLKSIVRRIRRQPVAAPPPAPAGTLFEAPALQIIMRRLWDEEVLKRSTVLRTETLYRLTKERDIVDEHVRRELGRLRWRERSVAASIIDRLVDPSGTKISVTVGALAALSGRSRKTIEKIVPNLAPLVSDAAPRAGVKDRSFEIAHDVLAPALSRWQVEFAHRRKLLSIGFGGLIAAVAALVLIVTTFQLWNEKAKLQEANTRFEGERAARLKAEANAAKAQAENQELANRIAAEAKLPEVATGADPAPVKVAPLQPRNLAALSRSVLWPVGSTIRARFLNGSAPLRARVQASALQWTEYANLNLEFGDDPDAEVRISFHPDGSWAYRGVDSRTVPQSEPTIMLGFVTDKSSDDELGGYVLHEMGHVLGLIHEMNQPNARIPWNLQKVWETFTGPPNFWRREHIERELIGRHLQGSFPAKPFDPKSIMMFPVSKDLTDGRFEAEQNRTLSDGDKRYIARLYPGRAPR